MDDASTRGAEIVAALTELSSEIRHIVLADEAGGVLAASAGADGERLARAGAELLAVARPIAGTGAAVAHVVVSAPDGAVVVCRQSGRIAVATTTSEPAEALVLHDLRSCLQGLEKPGRPRTRRRVAARDDA